MTLAVARRLSGALRRLRGLSRRAAGAEDRRRPAPSRGWSCRLSRRSSRDFAFVVDKAVEAGALVKAAAAADRKLITGVSVFDVFEGASLGEDKKSIAIEVAIQPVERTLTDEDFEALARRSSTTSPSKPAACCAADRTACPGIRLALDGGAGSADLSTAARRGGADVSLGSLSTAKIAREQLLPAMLIPTTARYRDCQP